MEEINALEQNYEIITNYKDCFDNDEFKEKCTEYYQEFDYIVGDFAYGKLRLKGFCDKNNKMFKEINDFNNLQEYLEHNCAYGCKYFVLKKIN
ncbi:MAG: YutD-like domain-containing protein [Bacilli bacterium]